MTAMLVEYTLTTIQQSADVTFNTIHAIVHLD